MSSRTKFAIVVSAFVVLLISFGEYYLAAAVVGFSALFYILWSIEVKLNLLLDEKGLKPNEDDYNR